MLNPELLISSNQRIMHLIEESIRMKNWYGADEQFDMLYPVRIRQLARRHWTPLKIALKAASFLAAEPGVTILDIGSGVGKFCLSAAHYKPHAHYCGVEQRKHLLDCAVTAKDTLQLQNVNFLHGNFTQLELKDYDHFYFYNSFYENLSGTDKIDESIDYSGELYNYYNRYLFRQLQLLPNGTRLATFHSLEDEIPPCYHVVWSSMDNLLKCWMKV